LAKGVRENAIQMNKLTVKIEKMGDRLEVVSAMLDSTDVYFPEDDFLTRLESMEKTLTELSLNKNLERESGHSYAQAIDPKVVDDSGNEIYRANSLGESIFDADSGKPIANYVEGLAEKLYSSEDIAEIADVYCRESMCKITYSSLVENAQGITPKGDNPELLERISEGLDGEDFNTYHARDEQGNEVIYLELE